MSKIAETLAIHMALANGYPSLISRLKRDDATRFLATKSSEAIADKLRDALAIVADSFETEVMPYAYLVALFLKGDRAALQKALKYTQSGSYKWYEPTAQFLISQTNVVNTVSRNIAAGISHSNIYNQSSTLKLS